MSGARYPEHVGCGGPMMPAASLDGLRSGAPLFCVRCKASTWGEPGDLHLATQAALEEGRDVVELPANEARPKPKPGVRKTLPSAQAEQLALLYAGGGEPQERGQG